MSVNALKQREEEEEDRRELGIDQLRVRKQDKGERIEVHSDDEVPSIAIIPFKNKGADEDVFYAYGISVDLISDVSSEG